MLHQWRYLWLKICTTLKLEIFVWFEFEKWNSVFSLKLFVTLVIVIWNSTPDTKLYYPDLFTVTKKLMKIFLQTWLYFIIRVILNSTKFERQTQSNKRNQLFYYSRSFMYTQMNRNLISEILVFLYASFLLVLTLSVGTTYDNGCGDIQ